MDMLQEQEDKEIQQITHNQIKKMCRETEEELVIELFFSENNDKNEGTIGRNDDRGRRGMWTERVDEDEGVSQVKQRFNEIIVWFVLVLDQENGWEDEGRDELDVGIWSKSTRQERCKKEQEKGKKREDKKNVKEHIFRHLRLQSKDK